MDLERRAELGDAVLDPTEQAATAGEGAIDVEQKMIEPKLAASGYGDRHRHGAPPAAQPFAPGERPIIVAASPPDEAGREDTARRRSARRL